MQALCVVMVFLKILTLFNSVLVVFFGIGAFLVIPGFERLFMEFGAELPQLTSLVLVSYPYWLLAAIIPVGIYIKYLRGKESLGINKTALLSVSIIMAVCLCLVLPTIIYAMYLPIFELGAADG
jgi:type II secretory pathway component PulF